jgi:hypothetical protein
MIVYKTIKDGKDRCVINNLKRDDFNFDCPNEEIVIVHYDIETHTRFGPENRRIHTPYIVGLVDNINNKFQYFTGSNCMENFIKHLFSYCKFKKVYLNAFNGSKFDHYEFVKKLHKMYDQNVKDDVNLRLDKLVLNNGAILKASVGNIDWVRVREVKYLLYNIKYGQYD